MEHVELIAHILGGQQTLFGTREYLNPGAQLATRPLNGIGAACASRRSISAAPHTHRSRGSGRRSTPRSTWLHAQATWLHAQATWLHDQECLAAECTLGQSGQLGRSGQSGRCRPDSWKLYRTGIFGLHGSRGRCYMSRVSAGIEGNGATPSCGVRAVVRPTDRLRVPHPKRMSHAYVTTEAGVRELCLYYGDKEVSFDEERLFPFGEQQIGRAHV